MPEEKTDEHALTTKPAEPRDDLVSSKHHLRVGRVTLDYTATTGRVVLREEVYEDGRFTGFKAKAEVSLTSTCRRRDRHPAGDVRVQRRSRLRLALVAHGRARAAQGRDGA